MRKPPACATGLLERLGPRDDAFAGDLLEEYSTGRSRSWYWRQVVAAVLFGSVRHVGLHPARTLAALATGWATLLLVFVALGDRTANGLAGWVWGWDRQVAYATQVWWPFAITATVVSYSGFALSAVAVVRVHRRHAAPMLLAYALSVAVGLVASAAVIEVLSQRLGRVPVPHPFFYVISVALPYHWRSGVLLAPTLILAIGVLSCPRSARLVPAAEEPT